jgi:hypothetical protein
LGLSLLFLVPYVGISISNGGVFFFFLFNFAVGLSQDVSFFSFFFHLFSIPGIICKKRKKSVASDRKVKSDNGGATIGSFTSVMRHFIITYQRRR